MDIVEVYESYSNFKVKGKKLWYQAKGFVTRNTHVQYESIVSFVVKVLTKIKVFKSRSNIKDKVTR